MPDGVKVEPESGAKRKRLAIVSSWNENCGNASYTYALKCGFERHYDVEILPLDLFLLQKTGRVFIRLGDKHIEDLAARLRDFDCVNIQFEAGLYGNNIKDMRRRVMMLIKAAPNLILTMHRVDMIEGTTLDFVVKSFEKLSFKPFFEGKYRNEFANLYGDIILRCREAARKKNVWVMVHTKRERRLVNAAYKMENCVDFPLCFLDAEARSQIQANYNPDSVRERYALPPNAKMMGGFGYISNYKGFETLIHAIAVLPKDWHLLVVGSQHPQSVKPWLNIDPYLELLLKEIEGVGRDEAKKAPEWLNAKIRINGEIRDLAALREQAHALMDRVRFVGNVDDDEFTFLLRNVDATVLPYLEVGQSMSGVVSLAVESGARLFCSNNLSFAEARRYYGRVYGNFDIGNYVEIAQKVQFEHANYDAQRETAYRRYNIANSINLHRHLFEHRAAPSDAALASLAQDNNAELES